MTKILFAILSVIGLTSVVHAGDSGQSVRRGSFKSENTVISYREWGAGDPIVLVHGMFGSADVWEELGLVHALAERYRVVALDLRGHGRSTKHYDPGDYGPKMAEDVVRLLDYLNIHRAHLLGYSYGGLVVLDVLIHHPDRVVSVVIGGSSRLRPGEPQDMEWFEGFASAVEAGKGFDYLAGSVVTGNDEQHIEEQRRVIRQRMAGSDLKAMAAVARGSVDLVVAEESLKANRVPVALFVGQLDPNVGEVNEMAALMSNSTVFVFSGATHVDVPRSSMFTQKVQEFLASHPR